MTQDEIRVLEYVAHGLGGPETIRADLRPIYRNLMERGLIKTVTLYQLSDDGEGTLKTTYAASGEKEK